MARRAAPMPGRGSVTERVYGALLGLYPAAFRERFGGEMLQLLRDQLRDARAPGARAGPLRTWIRVLVDLVLTAISEHAHQDRVVAQSLAERPTRLGKLFGVIGILGGSMLLAGFLPFAPWSADWFNLRLVLFNAGAITIALAAHRRHSIAAPRLALAGAIPVIGANAWYLALVILAVARAGEVGPADFGRAFDIAGIGMWLADAWFGLVVMRIARLSRWSGLALAIGSILGLGGMSRWGLVSGDFGQAFTLIAFTGLALNGLAWIALGLQIARGLRGLRPA